MTNLPHTRRTSRSLSNPLRSSALLAGILMLPAAAQDGERPDFAALKAEEPGVRATWSPIAR